MTDTLRAKLNEHGLALQERDLEPSNEPGYASAHPTLPQAPVALRSVGGAEEALVLVEVSSVRRIVDL